MHSKVKYSITLLLALILTGCGTTDSNSSQENKINGIWVYHFPELNEYQYLSIDYPDAKTCSGLFDSDGKIFSVGKDTFKVKYFTDDVYKFYPNGYAGKFIRATLKNNSTIVAHNDGETSTANRAQKVDKKRSKQCMESPVYNK